MNHFFQIFILILLISTPLSAQEIHGVYIVNQCESSDANKCILWDDFSIRQPFQIQPDMDTFFYHITIDGGFDNNIFNTSGSVDFLDSSTKKGIGQIPQVIHPRYISAVGMDKTYQTDYPLILSTTITS